MTMKIPVKTQYLNVFIPFLKKAFLNKQFILLLKGEVNQAMPRKASIGFAGIIIGLKVGLAIGGALAGSLLNVYGYVANVEQTPHAQFGIRMITSIWPAVFLTIGVIILFFYQINKSAETQMQDELAERRKVLKQK
jgi:Na+/melibiose symporter-like transporter